MQTSELTFCLISAAGDQTGTAVAATPDGMMPTLGALSLLRWKPTSWGVAVSASAETATGSVTVRLFAGDEEVANMQLSMAGPGQRVASSSRSVDLAQALGDTPLSVQLDVSEATDAGVTLTVQSRLEIHQLAAASGCLS